MEVRTAVLVKGQLTALLGLRTGSLGGMIVRVDPREPAPVVQGYNDEVQARKWFNRSLLTSRENGWQVVYDGQPLNG